MSKNTIELPPQTRAAEIASYDEGANTIDLVWTTGAAVRRYDWRADEPFDEILDVTPSAVRMQRMNNGAPLLSMHSRWDLSNVLGSIVPGTARLEGGKGYATAKLSKRSDVAGIVQDIKDGVIRNVSVGYRVHKFDKTPPRAGQVAQWRAVDWEPQEVSIVTVPADPGSQIRSEPTAEERARFAPCVVETRDEPTAEPSAKPEEVDTMPTPNGAAGQRGDTTTTETTPPSASETRAAPVDPMVAAREAADAAVRAERERSTAIVTLSSQHGLRALGDTHVSQGTSVENFRVALLDELAKRTAAPTEGSPGGGHHVRVGIEDVEKRGEAIATALLHRAEPGKFALTDAAREFRGMSLIEIARECLEVRGIRVRGMSKMEIAAKALDQATYMRSAGDMSTGDFPNILANVLNKTLRQGYEYNAQTFRPLVRVTSVSDFKQVSRVLLGEAPAFELVNEHGEFKRGGMGENAEKYSIATYGKIVGITRQVIVNDDLEAFTRVPRAFGVQAAQLESDLVWSQILSNPTLVQDGQSLFSAQHSNYVASGSGSAINITSVSAGRTAMSKQTGIDGQTVLNIDPTYLIVPKVMQTQAEQFVGQIAPTQTSNVVPDSLKRLQVIAEPRLDNGIAARFGIPAVSGSATQWYLSAQPGAIDVIELAYLEGNEGVYSETRMGFEVDGVEIKVRMDVGAKAIDFRGLYANAGQ